ncbi:MAG: DUF2179 domain-containing protein [Bacteroidales bacterium]|nr:DUF2179 domain-containing protein [Bacteroidales bacterium]
MDLLDSNIYAYLILPLLIIIARIVDVSIGTLKIIFISRGNMALAPVLGFFEVLVWLLAVTKIFENLDNWICYFAYPLGFAIGSFVGIKLEEKLAIGVQLIRIITRKDASQLIQKLRDNGYAVTSISAEGSQGKVGVLYSVVNRKNIPDCVSVIKELNPNAFYTIEDIRFVSQEIRKAKIKSGIQRSKLQSEGK